MAAAARLAASGVSVRVLEARDRIGGCMYTVHDPNLPIAVELGAEFIQGRPPRLLEISKKARLLIFELTGEYWQTARRGLVKSPDPRAGARPPREAARSS